MAGGTDLSGPRRPAWLTATLLVLGAFGVSRMTDGASTIDLLRHPDLITTIVARTADPKVAEMRDAWLGAVLAGHAVTLPLAIAALLLGALLAITATATLVTSASPGWLLQAIGANAALGALAHAATRGVRADMIARLGATASALTPDEVRDVSQLVGVTYGAALALQLGVLGAGAVALTRARARAFFAAKAAARRDEE